jgi:hypothetical protein
MKGKKGNEFEFIGQHQNNKPGADNHLQDCSQGLAGLLGPHLPKREMAPFKYMWRL